MAGPKRKVERKNAQVLNPVDSVGDGHGHGGDSSIKNLSTPAPSADPSMTNANLDANATFWRGLTSSVSQQSARGQGQPSLSHRQIDAEDPHEKYALHSKPCSQRVLLLQHPERKSRALYSTQSNQKPLEIRMKPKTGMVQVDIPLDVTTHYSRTKGVEFGSAVQRNRTSQQNDSHGVAGGLDAAPLRQSLRGDDALTADVPITEALENFEESRHEGRVLDRFTLGGRIEPFKDGDPVYMITTFSDSDCRWTKVDAIVQLRAQFTHLDALNTEKRRVASNVNESAEDRSKEERIEDVNMIIKDTADSDNADMYGGMTETSRLLHSMRDEPWQRLQWTDSNTQISRDIYRDALVHQQAVDVPYLVAKMTGDQYLDAISCPRVDPVRQGEHITASLHGDVRPPTHAPLGQLPRDDSEDEDEDVMEDVYSNDDVGHVSLDGPNPGQAFHPPEAQIERVIEKVCRMICQGKGVAQAKMEKRFSERFAADPAYAFLQPDQENHAYFRWRLGQNGIGNGIRPQYDHSRRP